MLPALLQSLPAEHLALVEAPPTAVSESVAARLSEVLAHRLRGPIAAVQGYAELLLDTLATPDQRDLVLRVFEAAAAAETMLAELQRYSVPSEPVLRPLSMAALATELTDLFDEPMALDLAEPSTVDADPMLLRQVVLALLANAHDAARGRNLGVLGFASGPVYTLDVWNEGRMDDGAADRAFDPFYTTKAQNLGLGLPLARRMTEAMGGRLLLTNAGSARVTFRLILPLVGRFGNEGSLR